MIGKDWEGLGKIGKDGKDWKGLRRIGKDWEGLGRIGKALPWTPGPPPWRTAARPDPRSAPPRSASPQLLATS